MPLNIPTFLTRTASAIVFVIIMLTGLLWNNWSFMVLLLLIQTLCIREYFQLVQQINPELYWPDWLPGAVQIIALMALFTLSPLPYTLNFKAAFFEVFSVLIIVFPAAIILAATLHKQGSLAVGAQGIVSLLYITLPMILLISMHNKSMLLPLLLICMIWINDTMAYIVGSFIGKTPFSPISPKKTWEGTVGGVILAIGVTIGWYLLAHHAHYYIANGLGQYGLSFWICLSVIAAIAGTAGDLLESKLKRMAGVKDSGKIMPGHGGALDRFDSLLVAVPFAACLTFLFS